MVKRWAEAPGKMKGIKGLHRSPLYKSMWGWQEVRMQRRERTGKNGSGSGASKRSGDCVRPWVFCRAWLLSLSSLQHCGLLRCEKGNGM